jgi:Tfp pilus assembly protein PilN
MTTRINLLPWREMRRRQQDRQLLTIAVAAWIVMGVIVVNAYLYVGALIEVQGAEISCWKPKSRRSNRKSRKSPISRNNVRT